MPAAFLMGECGVNAREAAVGGDAIWALIRDGRGGQKEERNEPAFGRHSENYCQLDLETRSIQAGGRRRWRRLISLLGVRTGFPRLGGACRGRTRKSRGCVSQPKDLHRPRDILLRYVSEVLQWEVLYFRTDVQQWDLLFLRPDGVQREVLRHEPVL